jgi:hypothetical protein
MPHAITLSEEAVTLLQIILATSRVEVTPANLETYRELVRAGIMDPVSTFARGPESLFRFTEEGWNRRDEWLTARTSAHPAGSP